MIGIDLTLAQLDIAIAAMSQLCAKAREANASTLHDHAMIVLQVFEDAAKSLRRNDALINE